MNTTLDSLKKEMANKVVAALETMRYMTSAEKDTYKNEVLEKLNNRLLLTTIRLQDGLTSAEDYNQTAYELYLDILTTFEYINNLYASINRHQLLNESIVGTLYATIGNLNDKLDEYEAIIGTLGYPGCWKEGFHSQNNTETDPKYYTERYGEQMPLSTHVRFNPDQGNITLNYTRQQNTIVYKSGVQLGNIMITKQYGAGFIKARNSESKLENCIDTSMSSYWSETILSDAELKIKGSEFTDIAGNNTLNRSFYDLPRGAMCEICINFEALTKINEIALRPFGNFPIDIVAIRYSLTDEEDDEIFNIVYPNNTFEPWLDTKSIQNEYVYHFPEITCKRLFILINQLHCIKNTYMISCDQMFKNELWFNATYDEGDLLKMPNSTVFAPMYLDRAHDDPVWKYINNKLTQNDQLDINDLLLNNSQKTLPITKYQYTYGFYNIAPNFVEFQKAGIWVSKEIECNGAVDTVSIESEEEHFKTKAGVSGSDIEFYITTKEDPAYDDWKPICPKNKNYVDKELLQLDYDYCYLRHTAVCGLYETQNEKGEDVIEIDRPIVYMNDIVMTENVDYILRLDGNSNAYAVEIPAFDHFSVYTVSYTPTDTSKELSMIDLNGEPLPNNSYEEIEGTGVGCYKLNNYPYYNRANPDITSSHVKIINTDTNEILSETAQANSPIECVTDKLHPDSSFRRFIENTNKIQYYTSGQYVYFNQSIKPNQKIEINYPSFDSKIRLKAILRRNSIKDTWMTPVLNNCKLMFSTI